MPTQTTTLLPGFGRPLNAIPLKDDPDYVDELFPNALHVAHIEGPGGRAVQQLLTLRELAMLQFMNSVTDKSEWYTKVKDRRIAPKWKDEACALASALGMDITPKMATWCIDELRHDASLMDSPASRPIIIYNGHVVKSDVAVIAELKEALQDGVARFEESITVRTRDWHPGSNEQVWDLVHPSLYPLVYGRTRVLENGETVTLENCIERCGRGKTTTVPPKEETFDLPENPERQCSMWRSVTDAPYSARFQWLPCEVDISGERPRITSYINNLHPRKQGSLYKILEKLIDAAIPLWNLTLAPLADREFSPQSRIVFKKPKYKPDPASYPRTHGPQQDANESAHDYWVRRMDWIRQNRQLIRPEPKGQFKPLKQPKKFDLNAQYGHRGLQVIIKLANIELTPEKPEYQGGSWHVEGQVNEHIVATALYYYSCENITTSTLSFRQLSQTEDADKLRYDQDDHDFFTEVFGCRNGDPGVQYIGSVETREGRLLTFQNILQHRVGPFSLVDCTKPGHRKIVALFLVDPNIKIISTAHVPCQQQEWWWEAASTGDVSDQSRVPMKNRGGINEFPVELQDIIRDYIDNPFSLEEAKGLRLELMEERKKFVINHGEAFESSEFSLCEH